jgi:hypothetical protein
VFLGGVLTEGSGWRWVLFVNPPIAALLLIGVFTLLPNERPSSTSLANFDVLGSVLVTRGRLLLVYALVKAPDQHWGSAKTIWELVGAAAPLATFVITESVVKNPLIPLGVFRIPGLGARTSRTCWRSPASGTMFFFLTLYMHTVLGFSPVQAGSAYLPLTLVGGMSAGSPHS